MNIDEKIEAKKARLLAVEEKRAKNIEEVEELIRQSSRAFRKADAHLKIQLGGHWLKLVDCKIDINSDFTREFEIQKIGMTMIYNSLPHCPECGNSVLKSQKGHWFCTKCKTVFQDKNGNPDFLSNS